MATVVIESRDPVAPSTIREYRVQIDDGPPSDWVPAEHIQVGKGAVVFTAPDSVHTIPIIGEVGTPT
ncbi:MAG: hypothetical protein V1685_04850 [Parcubacteria group bacterium]